MRSFETAFDGGDDPLEYLSLLESIHTDVTSGRPPVARPRRVIEESWQRSMRRGLHPDNDGWRFDDPLTPGHGSTAGTAGAAGAAGDSGDAASLTSLLPVLRHQLDTLLADDRTLLVLADSAARVVWRGGSRSMRRQADGLHFAPGCDWSERVVGTNGIGTALTCLNPVHVHGPEHFCVNQHSWSCAGAPVTDPRSRRTIGVINLSCRTGDAHSSAIVLATSLARQAELELREMHRRSLDDLAATVAGRSVSAGAWAAVDRWGWVAAASGVTLPRRVTLPDRLDGPLVVDRIGTVEAVPVTGGWLLVPCGDATAVETRVRVTLRGARCEVLVDGPGRSWSHTLSGRRAAVISALAAHPTGLSARELAAEVYGEEESRIAVRTVVHRIRQEISGLVETRPYRLSDRVVVDR
ncbi:GAF domain-containing protein [uncultured Corynebacterium sp.]|uniref:GAF domain-containing protein n=1 Tax=uncultured Corynebacterium sp. TaxID=159447 RepID=UPI0025FB87CB|nr:GAF domain-containing protein [uncultured Corynebacterium sp.]